LADLFGMSVSNATHWASYARRDWSAFAASRLESNSTAAARRTLVTASTAPGRHAGDTED
jgi:hypothetical protein